MENWAQKETTTAEDNKIFQPIKKVVILEEKIRKNVQLRHTCCNLIDLLMVS